MKKIILFVIIQILVLKCVIAQKTGELPNNRIVYFLKQDFKKAKIKIGFVNKLDNTKSSVSKKVLKNKDHSYIKFGVDNFYLSVDSLPLMSIDVCNELSKIKIDTTVRYGEPFSRAVSVVFIIDENGKIKSYGIARVANSSYYEDAVSKVLQEISISGYCKPAKIDNKPVCSLLRMSFSFGNNNCQVLTNTAPFF
jgi:hypothetical protein